MADRAGSFGSFSGALEQRDAEVIAEALADAYLEGAERSDDAERVQILQRIAERAILRLAWLRSLSATRTSGGFAAAPALHTASRADRADRTPGIDRPRRRRADGRTLP